MKDLKERFLRLRASGLFANGLLLFCVTWMTWNWLAPFGWQFDPAPWEALTLCLSIEASWATALLYQSQLRSDEKFRTVMERNHAEQAQRVKEVLALLESEDNEEVK